ncbi:hypothetical protein N9C75_02035 [Alphaproteobacteria bacterium]|mgnify:FL=1|jgi:hypothetical protein|nr:hypothetical protein [Alphaproteobacteria bacterium]MDA9815815.1 hypothetical protein [Alphaproteobacteria bacterium]
MRKIDLRFLGLCAIGSLFSGLLGFMIAAGNNVILDGHEHPKNPARSHLELGNLHPYSTNHEKKHDSPIHIGKNIAVPTIIAKLEKDPVSGFNLNLETSNFIFAPELSGLEHKNGMGHAHLYIDGQKIARLYGNWFHIIEIPKGAKTLEITLNSNDHRPFFLNNILISSIITVENEH